MTLQQYLSEKQISNGAFAKLVGVSEFGVRKWVSGERIPRPSTIQKIQEVTGGAVTFNDFCEAA